MSGGRQKELKFDDIKWRVNPEPPRANMYSTRIPTLDEHMGGGLPFGLTCIYGGAGVGKSELARSIAMQCAKAGEYILYFCCEVLSDAPKHESIDVVDFTRYLPKASRAFVEMNLFIENLEPSLVILDSMTSFFSISRKALPESELREIIAKVHTDCEGKLPILGISEIRGTGYNETTAGGEGVRHANTSLMYMEKKTIRYKSDAEAYGLNISDVAYFLTVEKHKWGTARTHRVRVMYEEDEKYMPILMAKRSEG